MSSPVWNRSLISSSQIELLVFDLKDLFDDEEELSPWTFFPILKIRDSSSNDFLELRFYTVDPELPFFSDKDEED